jgi:hypothetical protein
MQYGFRFKIALFASAVLSVGLFAASTARADELYGRIRGTVLDPSGAVVVGARVRVTNTGTGLIQERTTDQNGAYEIPNLPVGTYSVTISKTGFRTHLLDKIQLTQNQVYVDNAKLELGAITEEVTITANAAQVEQTSIQLTSTINDKTITDLPLNGRNWVTLQQTLPGVVLPDTRFNQNYSTNGSQAQQNSYLMNGNDFNDLPLNTPLTPPNPDTIAEVKMVTNTINPEFGRNSGAILNAVTKSGTNNFHGSAFEFYRDTSLNTKNYFQLKPSIFHQNQYGGTVGGPIWKNKMFFFFGLQNTRASQPSTNGTGTTTVYTAAQLQCLTSATPCDFSATNFNGKVVTSPTLKVTNPKKSPFPMFGDDQSPCPASGGVMCPAGTFYGKNYDPTTGNLVGNGLFSTGLIPAGEPFNSLAASLVKQFVPLPNTGVNQFSFQPIQSVKINQYIGRYDFAINQKDTIWFYAYANNNTTLDDLPFTGSTLPGFGQSQTPYTKQFTLSWNHTVSVDMLNELRLGYTRLNFNTVNPQKVVQPASVGFTNIFSQISSGASYPFISLTGYFNLGFSTNGPQPRKDQTYQLTDNFSWIKGRHSLKFGYDGRKFQVWNPFAARNNGSFSFTTSGRYSSADAGLNFLLGVPSSYAQGSGAVIIADAYEHYMYFQDQMRIRPNLTITLGTGYQIDTPIAEYQFQGINRVCLQPGVNSKTYPAVFDPVTGALLTGAPPAYTFPTDPGCNKYGGATTKYSHFGPRVGFAYSPDSNNKLTGGPGKTSIRGGFGIYFNRGEEELNLQDLGNPPTGQNSLGVGDLAGKVPAFPDPWTDVAGGGALTNKFPYAIPAPGAVIDFSQFFPLSINVIDPHLTIPYAMNYHLTFERELPGQMIVRVGYVGAQGRKLITSTTFNPTTPAGIQACLADPNNGTGNGCADNPDGQPGSFPTHYAYSGVLLNSPTGPVLTQVYGNSGIERSNGWSNYNSLQFTVDKRFSHGLQFLSAYTWSHSLDVGSSFEDTSFLASGAGGISPYDLSRDYGSSAFDARNRWVVSFSYDIPAPQFLPRVLGGWRLTGINAIQSGSPILFQDSNELSLTCSLAYTFYACPDRPDLVTMPKALDPRASTKHYYFAPASFADNALGTMGNVGRGFMNGPGYWNTDFSVQKDTKITERTRIQLRLETFNLFNHTNFRNPTSDFASGNFGRVTNIRANTNSRLVQLGAKFIF